MATRPLPRRSALSEFFWASGAEGILRFLRCEECDYFVHPPSPICPRCLQPSLRPSPVSGRATVESFTVTEIPWVPGIEPPYVVAIVAMDEQPDLKLVTNVVGCSPDHVRIGMDVHVVFERSDVDDEVWFPLFEPAAAS